MRTTDRFNSLDEVREERVLLKARRDAHVGALRAHWERFKNKEFRRALLLDAASEALHPATALGAIAEGVKLSGGWLPLLGPLLTGRKGVLGSRLFWSGLSLALPLLVNADSGSRLKELWARARTAYEHVKDRFNPPVHDDARNG